MAISTGHYGVLMGKLQAASRQQRRPLRAMMELTYRCNFACVHCYNSDAQKATQPAQEMTTQQVCEVIDQIKDIGCLILGFTGGEVFVRPDALEIFEYAARQGFQVIIYTNGFHIDEHVADALQLIMPNKVDISVHGWSRNTFEQIAQRRGSHDRVMRAIQLLVDRRVPVGLKSNLFELNADEIQAIKDFAVSIGAAHRLSTNFFGRNDGSPEPFQYQLSPERLEQVLGALNGRVDSDQALSEARTPLQEIVTKTSVPARLQAAAEPLFTCGVGTTGFVVNPFGEMKACLEFDEPRFKIADSSLSACWDMVVNFTDKANLTEEHECKACELKAYCDSCPASRYLATGSFFKCDMQARKRAELQQARAHSLDSRPRQHAVMSRDVESSDSSCGVCSKGCG